MPYVGQIVFKDGSQDYGVQNFEPCQTFVEKGDLLGEWSPIGIEIHGEILETEVVRE